ncbi:benzyl alcohol O-benzoyltransferase [Humulus lupulus]|uniref:benzyl alcohol O-benzoyltransferase n=1 Tax=Humulus lupulus TaxID=3486 RepID=UPI002B402DBB|nr:benzyl alcohol O-benzoyltransferase [Humulus lupulus]
MATPAAAPLVFKVRRAEPQLVAPAKATPKELKLLSDIDDQEGLRFHIPVIQFYKYEASMRGRDPVKVIRDALAQTLVFYYPFAGRLRELAGTGRKLAVECTGEGVLFVEADADVTLNDFGDALQPPFPCLEDLIFDVPGSGGVLHSPLMLIQVTRLACGGFIFALRLNHTMSDAAGLVQFMTAVGEIARGAGSPSVPPVWQRELLNARNPPRVTCEHREYEEVADTKGTIIPLDDMAHRSFFFGPTEVAALRRLVPPHIRRASTFELLTACLWKCRTTALKMDPEEEVRIICIVNARSKFNPPLPRGYYGNAFAFPVAVTTAGKLCENPVGYAVELVKRAKEGVTEEYMQSVADLMVSKERPHFTVVRSYLVSDLTHAGFGEVDLGWGRAVYGGAAKGGVGAIPGVASFYIPFTNKVAGEQGIVVPVCLPAQAMDTFVEQLNSMLKPTAAAPHTFIASAL